jgi:hypothetical protein
MHQRPPMQIAPIVYLGPSLPSSDAEVALPGCDLRAPIRRGDLYRDRLGGGSVFVIIDGVFHQEPAVPPREILDVLEDGAMIVGASSMGALRAAECWPAGMRGVGTIYRLYRRGALHSDDEVILVYSSDGSGYQSRSVPLINVRYALSRALRKGRLGLPAAERVVASAQRLHFPERCWPVILSNAGVLDPEGELQTFVSSLDLKREDAARCLRTVARWLADAPALAERPRRLSTTFIPSEVRRQREYDALAGLDREEVKRDLSRWQMISGRYSRHLLRIAAVDPEVGLAARLKKKCALAPLLADLVDRRHSENGSIGEAESQANVRTAALVLVLIELWKALGADQQGFAEAVWAELTASGELDAEIFRWRAVRDAVRVARGHGLSMRARDQFLAESEIAHAHGFQSWQDLQQASTLAPFPWSDFVAYRDELALAKRLRQELFNPWPFKLE